MKDPSQHSDSAGKKAIPVGSPDSHDDDPASALDEFDEMLTRVHEWELKRDHEMENQATTGALDASNLETGIHNDLAENSEVFGVEQNDEPDLYDVDGGIELEFHIGEDSAASRQTEPTEDSPASMSTLGPSDSMQDYKDASDEDTLVVETSSASTGEKAPHAMAAFDPAEFMQDHEDASVEDTLVLETTEERTGDNKCSHPKKPSHNKLLITILISVVVILMGGLWWYLHDL